MSTLIIGYDGYHQGGVGFQIHFKLSFSILNLDIQESLSRVSQEVLEALD